MPTLETPNSGTDTNLPPMASGGDGSTHEKAKDAQTYDVEDSKPEHESDKEAPDGVRKEESPMDELPEATQREAELQRQIDGLQSQVTELHKTRAETNPELSSEFKSLKEKLNKHSKQLEQSAEKLSQLESENLTLRDENQALNMTSNKKC
ncbi:hypothetical protein F2Q70_00029186 [Brassica cretica]|uniref:Uncharacterized protein n=1 Tax=Brassica cretica TaxID=69181 RepID=A0A8S9FMD8_BRACR|nr:hypothetical protein F2Q70_00029186 [Brassica cretica]